MPTPLEVSVLAANRAFYTAFKERDVRGIERIWSEDHPISCIHPGWAPLFGRQAVLASWRAIFGSSQPPEIEMSEPHAVVLSKTTAFVVCTEHLAEASIVATNVFMHEQGEWRLIHHQGGPLPNTRSSRPPVSRQMN